MIVALSGLFSYLSFPVKVVNIALVLDLTYSFDNSRQFCSVLSLSKSLMSVKYKLKNPFEG